MDINQFREVAQEAADWAETVYFPQAARYYLSQVLHDIGIWVHEQDKKNLLHVAVHQGGKHPMEFILPDFLLGQSLDSRMNLDHLVIYMSEKRWAWMLSFETGDHLPAPTPLICLGLGIDGKNGFGLYADWKFTNDERQEGTPIATLKSGQLALRPEDIYNIFVLVKEKIGPILNAGRDVQPSDHKAAP